MSAQASLYLIGYRETFGYTCRHSFELAVCDLMLCLSWKYDLGRYLQQQACRQRPQNSPGPAEVIELNNQQLVSQDTKCGDPAMWLHRKSVSRNLQISMTVWQSPDGPSHVSCVSLLSCTMF